jgi:hypothetical protein
MATIAYAGFPTATLYKLGTDDAPPAKLEAERPLLWGDYMSVLGEAGDFLRVKFRANEGWVRKSSTHD